MTAAITTIIGFIGISLLPIPSAPFIFAAGAAFGPLEAFAYALLGETVGAIVAFAAAKKFGEKRLEAYVRERHKKLQEYNLRLEQGGATAAFVLRVIPVIPLFALNFGLGLTKMSFTDYLLGTIAGLAVMTGAYSFFGETAVHASASNLMISGFGVAGIAVISVAGKKYLKRK